MVSSVLFSGIFEIEFIKVFSSALFEFLPITGLVVVPAERVRIRVDPLADRLPRQAAVELPRDRPRPDLVG
jgi:hypothetical protein